MDATRIRPVALLRQHWPEYLIEAWGLGTFMVAAGIGATLLEYPGSPVHQALAEQPLMRRLAMGVAMGLTAVVIIYSPWGKRSGAHINPAITLTFWRLGKVGGWDALFYALAQCTGGIAGVVLVALAVGVAFTDPPVAYAATVPGEAGRAAAFVAEMAMAFAIALIVLLVSRRDRLAPLTGIFAGLMVATCITLFAPLSGFGINPARSLASALPGGIWTSFWIYVTAPPLGMLLAAELHQALTRQARLRGAKLVCSAGQPCIHCGYDPALGLPRPCAAPQMLFDAGDAVGCAPSTPS